MAQAAVSQFSAVLDDAVEAERLRKAEEERARLTRALVTAVKTTNYAAVERLTQDQVSPMRLQINDVPADVLHNAEGSAVCHPLCTASLLHILTSALNQSTQTSGCLEVLLRAGADVHLRDDAGKTPLHWAATLASLDQMTMLLAEGARPNDVDNQQVTPLHCLLGNGIASRELGQSALDTLVRPLLDAAADPTMRDARGFRPYDLQSPVAGAGPAAVEAARAAAAPDTAAPEAPGPPCARCQGDHQSALCPYYARPKDKGGGGRWAALRPQIAARARALDEQRDTFLRSVVLLLMWRRSESCRLPFLADDVLQQIVLFACPDHGLAASWRAHFREINHFGALLQEWRRRAAAARAAAPAQLSEASVVELGDQHDNADRLRFKVTWTKATTASGKGLRQRLLLTLEEFMERAKEIEEMAAADEPDPASAVSGEIV